MMEKRKFVYTEVINSDETYTTQIEFGKFEYEPAPTGTIFNHIDEVQKGDTLTKYFFSEFKAKMVEYKTDCICLHDHVKQILAPQKTSIWRKTIQNIFPSEVTVREFVLPGRKKSSHWK
jgi:hypothetical protein